MSPYQPYHSPLVLCGSPRRWRGTWALRSEKPDGQDYEKSRTDTKRVVGDGLEAGVLTIVNDADVSLATFSFAFSVVPLASANLAIYLRSGLNFVPVTVTVSPGFATKEKCLSPWH